LRRAVGGRRRGGRRRGPDCTAQVDDRIVLVPVKPTRALRGFLRGLDTAVPRDDDRV
jgi:hypothetical protein